MSTSTIRSVTSIIVPCWNQLEFTRQCIAAIEVHTRRPWELIVIDNGSTDHTDIYLAGLREGAAVPATVGPTIRSCCSTWARSPSKGASGTARSGS
jgi:Glycosyl transferase family 2